MVKTLEDIAKELNVSTATVSRALNLKTRDMVSDETREKVLDLVKKTGFKPNIRARGLASGKFNNLFFLLSHNEKSIFYDQYFFNIIKGILRSISNTEYSLSILSIGQDQPYEQIFNSVMNNETAGLIFSSYCNDIRFPFDLFNKYSFPIITLDDALSGDNIYSILLDHKKAGYIAGEHLAKVGRENIFLISDINRSKHSELRKKGFIDYFENVVPGKFKINEIPMNLSMTSGLPALESVLSICNPPVSIFALSDEVATGIITHLSSRNLKCPMDVAVLGFDGLEIRNYVFPTMRSVAFPFGEIGARIGKVFLSLMDGEHVEKVQIIQPEITDGLSS